MKIIIVEDDLSRALSLADQFEELSISRPDLNIEIGSICYFNSSKEAAQKRIAEQNVGERNIEIVSLWNFYEVMEQYYHDETNPYVFIMDFLLENDGSGGRPECRVNIRYARNMGRLDSGKIWFYTTANTLQESILNNLTQGHVLYVAALKGDYMRLHLEDNDKFISYLCANSRL